MPWTFGPILISGQSLKDEPETLETQVESGPVHRTLLSTDYMATFNGSVYLADAAALTAWRIFVQGDAGLGTKWFDVPIRGDGAVISHEVRMPSWGPRVPQGQGWRMPFVMETREHK